MAEGPIHEEPVPRPSRWSIAVVVIGIAFVILAAILRLVTLTSSGSGETGGARLWSLLMTSVFAIMAGFLAWQLLATLAAARRRATLYRFDPAGAHCFPVMGRARSIPWENLEGIQKTKDALFLLGRSAGGRRAAFIAPLRGSGADHVLAVIRHYRPDLLTESPRS